MRFLAEPALELGKHGPMVSVRERRPPEERSRARANGKCNLRRRHAP